MHSRSKCTKSPGARSLLLCAVAWLGEASAAPSAPPRDPLLHVASPDWRDQVIYFLMIDRFDNANPANDDQRRGEFDPSDGAKFSGGDLAGITRRIDYLRELGATAVWITPPVANRWWDPRGRYGGYHGYWAENFVEVDRHFGTLADYQTLSRQLHAAGMYLVQDIVLNHTANYFSYADKWKSGDPVFGYTTNPQVDGRSAPTQAPFDLNDPRVPSQRAAAIYHWTPAITDFGNRHQELDYQLAELDDLNTENPAVRAALRKSYAYWIESVGVDAFRVDTAFYVPPDMLRDFLHSTDREAPGILGVAGNTGRHAFHVFGEGFGVEAAYSEAITRKLDAYMRSTPRSPAALPAMLNFPLYGSTGDVFARGRPTAELGYRIRRMMQVHQRPHLMPSFVDNHDVDRFLAGGSEAALRQSLLLIMTLPGIPTLYYGTEQGFAEQRASMFATGFGSAGRDHFDTSAALYQYLRRAIALRRDHRVLSRGTPRVLQDNAAGPGVLAFAIQDGKDQALVVFNSADETVLMDNLASGLPGHSRLRGVFGIDRMPDDLQLDSAGRITLRLEPRSASVWKLTAERGTDTASSAGISLDALPRARAQQDFDVHGTAKGIDELQLVVDGRLASAQRVRPASDGRWRARVATQDLIDPAIEHRIVAWSASPPAVSPSRAFRVAREWQVLADIEDPAGDDHGPTGHYELPTDAGWREHHQLDLRGVRVAASGSALRLELRMAEVSSLWNAPNGFDHVAFTVFIQKPGSIGGSSVMPFQQAQLPDGMRWDLRLRAGGWTNALFAAEGAGTNHEGRVVMPTAQVQANAAGRRITLTVPAQAFGAIDSWSGAKIYVTTWDYDGGYRALRATPEPAAFGGGGGGTDALIMDASEVIVLP